MLRQTLSLSTNGANFLFSHGASLGSTPADLVVKFGRSILHDARCSMCDTTNKPPLFYVLFWFNIAHLICSIAYMSVLTHRETHFSPANDALMSILEYKDNITVHSMSGCCFRMLMQLRIHRMYAPQPRPSPYVLERTACAIDHVAVGIVISLSTNTRRAFFASANDVPTSVFENTDNIVSFFSTLS